MSTPVTANDRFKQSSRSSFWISLIVATLIHAAAFAGSPLFALDPAGGNDVEVQRLLEVPPELRLPEPPQPIQRPAAPVPSVAVSPDLTIDPTMPTEWDGRSLEPPAPEDNEEAPVHLLGPTDIAPRLLNTAEVQRALREHYPPLLRDAGAGGVASVWFHIDADGRVVETRIQQSSGYRDLDQAALRVARIMKFSPAMNRDRRIPVWVAIRVTFESLRP